MSTIKKDGTFIEKLLWFRLPFIGGRLFIFVRLATSWKDPWWNVKTDERFVYTMPFAFGSIASSPEWAEESKQRGYNITHRWFLFAGPFACKVTVSRPVVIEEKPKT